MKSIKRFFVLLTFLFLGIPLAQAKGISLKFAFIGDKTGSAYKGSQQGLDEANLQGQFLGQYYELVNSTEGVAAILVAADIKTLVFASSEHRNTVIFNLTLTDDQLRLGCYDNVLHIIPSDRMLSDAEAQWISKHPNSTARAQAWNHDFLKFAARDLNKRFKKAYKQNMDDNAWAGWAAVKMLTDTVARKGLVDSATLLQSLKTDLSFDGQKGISMTFRRTGQLRQPILLVENGKTVGEAPVRGVAKTLDSLGTLDCPKSADHLDYM